MKNKPKTLMSLVAAGMTALCILCFYAIDHVRGMGKAPSPASLDRQSRAYEVYDESGTLCATLSPDTAGTSVVGRTIRSCLQPFHVEVPGKGRVPIVLVDQDPSRPIEQGRELAVAIFKPPVELK